MLICPQCQFENPNSNKFCQSCGTSLVHKVCHACGTQVELDLQRCNNCDAECGKIWLAIVSKLEPVAIANGGVASSEITSHL